MKVIYNNVIPFDGFAAINLCGLLFVRNGVKITDKLLNHEEIHSSQMKELGYIGFYLAYVIEWGIKCMIYKDSHAAYRNISFEREAYNNEADPEYLKKRKGFAWKDLF